jgi:hypothetical protein
MCCFPNIEIYRTKILPSRENQSNEPYLESCYSWIGSQNVSLQFVKLWCRWRLGLPQFWVTIVIIQIVTYTDELLASVVKRNFCYTHNTNFTEITAKPYTSVLFSQLQCNQNLKVSLIYLKIALTDLLSSAFMAKNYISTG